MPIRIGKAVVGVVAESPAFTYVAPDADDAFAAFDISVSPEGENYQRQESRGDYGKLDSVPAGATGEISFKVASFGSGATGPTTPPDHDVALFAVGMKREANPSASATSHTYKPTALFDGGSAGTDPTVQQPEEAYSVAAWFDGIKYAIKGAVGNAVFTWTVGSALEIAFTFRGAYVATIDQAIVTPTSASTTVPPTFLSAGFTVDGYAAEIEQLSVDLGNELGALIDANDPNGTKGFTITNRRATGSINPNMVLAATYNFFAKWRAGATFALSTGSLGPAAGNKIQLVVPRGQFNAPSVGDREANQILDIPFACGVAAGGADGDEFQLIYT